MASGYSSNHHNNDNYDSTMQLSSPNNNPALISPCYLGCSIDQGDEEEEEDEDRGKKMIPASIQDSLQGVMDVAIKLAVSHWCCIAFKVAPVSLNDIQCWKDHTLSIRYCIAAISLISLSSHHHQENKKRRRDAAIVLYQRARYAVDDAGLYSMDNLSTTATTIDPMMIQAYFCLSYTSNLLGFYEHQRTWAGLAATSLIQSRPMIGENRALLQCWYRWYYVDAWVSLTSGRHRLLPDELPSPPPFQDDDNHHHHHNNNDLRPFAVLAHHMRRLKNRNDIKTQSLLNDLDQWWHNLSSDRNTTLKNSDPHLHLCFYAMRLVVLFQLLMRRDTQQCVPRTLLVECLYTNLQLLSGLQHLRDTGCDHSTYHSLFLAIHNTAHDVFLHTSSPDMDSSCCEQQQDQKRLHHVAIDQLKINIELMESTAAYVNDVYCLRQYAAQCRRDAISLGISMTEKKQHQESLYQEQGRQVGTVLFRLPKSSTSAPSQHHPAGSTICYDGIHLSAL
ncbi:hypothetical protein RO3G_15037 [Lichtheimia corymbifera JMRC:FSU:9682]|uniref:Transcription factor domain-containing protein n=1 Tax=Lichtheimia corymbifera JMRC:FSU:9682 TaxID=1263082 RepID=A0A068S2P8_9FUNG|nr:hypothetical protein RO3G_15037 [Lichtheimia corymbifera JMRC:FSU:9682]